MKGRGKSGNNSIIGYIFSLAIGLIVGFRAINAFVAVPFVALSLVCLYFAFRNEFARSLALLPYIIYSELFVRSFVRSIPYLFVQYILIALFGVLLTRGNTRVRLHSKSFIFLSLFGLIELLDLARSTQIDVARGIFINSFVLVIGVLWASFNTLSGESVNKILKNVKYASIYLCGIVLARYVVGDVEFSTHSGSEGTNGLAPVQISGYLGFSCSVFIFSLMDESERKQLWLNVGLLCVCSIMMILSFSRGGLYFMGIIMALYVFFNRGKSKSYLMLILLIPVSAIVLFYVTAKTGGKIQERYEQKGSSGRDQLVQAGWDLFVAHPLAGVGTGEFNKAVHGSGLYGVESGAHDEFIRVIAEHGVLGLLTYWGFFLFLFAEILRRKKTPREFGIYFLVFFCLISVHNGLKISLQPLLLVLAVATTGLNLKRKNAVPAQYQFSSKS